MLLLLSITLAGPASASGLRFPAGDADYSAFYPTAYKDHGGSTDWACGSNTYSGHNGSDFGVGSWDGMAAGREIVAAAAGSVLYTNDGAYDECSTGDCDGGDGYGNYVWLQHPDGSQTIYAHMKQWSVAVASGETVACGDYLGEVGSSGYSTGPHLHFEVRAADGSKVDPFVGDCSSGTSLWVDQGDYGGLPAPVCDDVPACEPITTLTCGDVVEMRNDGAGSTNEHGFYGCVTYTYSAPEVAFEVKSSVDEVVTVQLTGLAADLDLFALTDTACDATGCVTASSEGETADESVAYDASAGDATVVVVDGWEGAVSDFRLEVLCSGVWSEEGGTTGGTGNGGSDSGSDGGGDGGFSGTDDALGDDTGSLTGERPGTRTALDEELAGCGCGGGPTGALWPVLLALLGLRRRS